MSLLLFCPVDIAPLCQELVGSLHGHATKIRDEMRTRSVAGEVTFRTFASVLAAKRKHVATVAAPAGANVGNGLKAVRYPVVDFHFVTILGEPASTEHVPK